MKFFIETNNALLNNLSNEYINSETLLLNSIKSDLHNLLNTRKIGVLEEYSNTVLSYGVFDLSIFNAESSEDKEQFKNQLEKVIAIYEPRLKNVSIELLKNNNESNGQIYFYIKGVVYLNQEQINIKFQSVLDNISARFKMKGVEYDE